MFKVDYIDYLIHINFDIYNSFILEMYRNGTKMCYNLVILEDMIYSRYEDEIAYVKSIFRHRLISKMKKCIIFEMCKNGTYSCDNEVILDAMT